MRRAWAAGRTAPARKTSRPGPARRSRRTGGTNGGTVTPHLSPPSASGGESCRRPSRISGARCASRVRTRHGRGGSPASGAFTRRRVGQAGGVSSVSSSGACEGRAIRSDTGGAPVVAAGRSCRRLPRGHRSRSSRRTMLWNHERSDRPRGTGRPRGRAPRWRQHRAGPEGRRRPGCGPLRSRSASVLGTRFSPGAGA